MDDTLAKFFPDVEGKLRETKRKSIYLWESLRAKIAAASQTTKGDQLKFSRDLGTVIRPSDNSTAMKFK